MKNEADRGLRGCRHGVGGHLSPNGAILGACLVGAWVVEGSCSAGCTAALQL